MTNNQSPRPKTTVLPPARNRRQSLQSHDAVVCAVAGITLLTSACAPDARKTAAAKPKRKYVYVPVTGSHIGRRVMVNEDGTAAAAPDGPVQVAHPSVLGEMQRKGSVKPGRDN